MQIFSIISIVSFYRQNKCEISKVILKTANPFFDYFPDTPPEWLTQRLGHPSSTAKLFSYPKPTVNVKARFFLTTLMKYGSFHCIRLQSWLIPDWPDILPARDSLPQNLPLLQVFFCYDIPNLTHAQLSAGYINRNVTNNPFRHFIRNYPCVHIGEKSLHQIFHLPDFCHWIQHDIFSEGFNLPPALPTWGNIALAKIAHS